MKTIVALFLLLALPGCAAHMERSRIKAENRAFAEVQPMADFELRCSDPATLEVIQAYKRHPITVGAHCEGKQVAFTRPLKTRTWYRADQVPGQYQQNSFMRDVAVVGTGVYLGNRLSR